MVEITYLAIAGIALIAMFFGYGFGLFEGRSQGYKKRQKEEAANKAETPAPEPVTVKVDDPGMLRIKNEGGYLALDLDGARVDTSALTADERKRLIEMLGLMRPWLEGKHVPAPERTSHPPQSLPQQSTPLTTPPAAPRPVPSQPTGPRPSTIAREDRPVAPAGSIVTQIDSVLQSRLAGTPLEDRGIFLAQSPEGGVMVYVGLTKYMGIEDVPDPEVKAAIRAAIAEWEDKYTPGL
ncbi:MAG TPA: hypothetical protein VHO49_04310 [Anaerolineales bacterium]|nr:hypothetical protein [Anaerolineales bacterium]